MVYQLIQVVITPFAADVTVDKCSTASTYNSLLCCGCFLVAAKLAASTVRKMGYMPVHSNGCPRGATKLATGTAVDSCCAASTYNSVLQMYVL